MTISKLLKPFTITTAILTAWVYIDTLWFYGAFFITIPLAVLAALTTIVLGLIKRQYGFVLINLILSVVAVISFFVFPW